jgi:hypothetical protein
MNVQTVRDRPLLKIVPLHTVLRRDPTIQYKLTSNVTNVWRQIRELEFRFSETTVHRQRQHVHP